MDGATPRVVLISAPAGSGKAVLCATLAQGELPVDWVTLDEVDDDFPIFVALPATALRSHLQDAGRAVLNFLRLDDYHTIADPAIPASASGHT